MAIPEREREGEKRRERSFRRRVRGGGEGQTYHVDVETAKGKLKGARMRSTTGRKSKHQHPALYPFRDNGKIRKTSTQIVL